MHALLPSPPNFINFLQHFTKLYFYSTKLQVNHVLSYIILT